MKLHEFFVDVSILTGGKAVALGIRLLTVPLISRIFLPDVYGVAALYVSITAILTTVSILSFPQAIVLPKSDDQAANLICLTLVSVGIVAAVFWGMLIALQPFDVAPFPDLAIWVWSIPIAFGLQGLTAAVESWLTRHRHFRRSAIGDVSQATATGSIRVLIGLMTGSVLWPLIASLLVGWVSRLSAYRSSISEIGQRLKAVSRHSLKTTAREFRDFPLYNTPAALLFALSAQFPVLAIAFLFTPREVGQYAMVQALLIAMIATAGESIRRAYLHRASRQSWAKGELRGDYRRMVLGLAALAAVPSLILIFFGEALFVFVVGRNWIEAGSYIALLTPWFFFQWISRPAAAMVISLRKQRFWLVFQGVALMMQGAAVLTGFMMGGDLRSVLTGYVLVTSCLLMFLVLRVYFFVPAENTDCEGRSKESRP